MAQIRDLAIGTVLTAPSPATSGTTLVLDTSQGSLMPTTVPFKLLAYPPSTFPTIDNSERILVTARSGDTLTIVRAQGETTAKTIAAGWLVSNNIFADDLAQTSLRVNQEPTGLINSSNTTYTLSESYFPGTLKVHLNGQTLRPGASNDYVETSTGFTMNYAPATGDVLHVDYLTGIAYNLGNSEIFVRGVVPTGTVNGSNALFTLPTGYTSNSLQVYINGVRQRRTTDYTENATAGTFTLIPAPATGQNILVDYIIGSTTNIAGGNSFISDETPTGTVNSSNTAFTVLYGSYVPSSLEVFINGLKQKRGTDYTETTPETGTFTMTPAPITGDVIHINYQYALATAGNADTVDGYHAAKTPTANTIPVLDSSSRLPEATYRVSLSRTNRAGSTMSGFAAETDMGVGVGITVTTAMAGREIELELNVPQISSTVAGDRATVRLKEDGVNIQQYYMVVTGHGWAGSLKFQKPMPAVGNHTYSATVERDSGTGTLSLWSAGNSVIQMIVRMV